ncbi:MAG: T9SS type A sorting domain-containing protein [Chlorobi bacterium]|nr:T9SS type A sorting domain-containing protein [Chlorobiota bacterium]
MKKYLFAFFLVMSLSEIFGQVDVTLTIENQSTVGTDFYFDIYLQAPNDPLYLGNADFVLYFNSANFTSPTLTKEPTASPGSCNLVPTDASGLNPLFTQDQYFNNTAVSIINGNELTINLNGPAPSDQATFDTRVARIEGSSSTHRLGRFKVSGISNPSGTMGLTWKTNGSGVITKVFTLGTISPWTGSEVNSVSATDPPAGTLPVELTSFTAEINEKNKVLLNWETATEINNYGFSIERKSSIKLNEEENWKEIGFVEGHGNSNSPKSYSFIDDNLSGGSKFVYRLKQIDVDGTFEYSEEIEIDMIPTKYELSQNYPNPFNPATKINFSLRERGTVKLFIYDILGKKIIELVNEEMEAGVYERTWNASQYSSGVYIYMLSVNGKRFVKKMNLLK